MKVEECLFRVPQEPFVRESQAFRNMFDLPGAEDGKNDGADESHPLRLDGIQKGEFRVFLKALYAPYVTTDFVHRQKSMTVVIL